MLAPVRLPKNCQRLALMPEADPCRQVNDFRAVASPRVPASLASLDRQHNLKQCPRRKLFPARKFDEEGVGRFSPGARKTASVSGCLDDCGSRLFEIEGASGPAMVNQDVSNVRISVSRYALDRAPKTVGAVVDRGNDDQWRCLQLLKDRMRELGGV